MTLKSARDWIAQNSNQIRSLDPGAPEDDLTGLLGIIGDARVVGLGESTHGTREFSLLKDRIIRMLVKRAGFRVVAFERDVPLVEAIGRYVAGEALDPRTVFSFLNAYPWQTEEFRQCVEWLRAWSEDSDDVVSFVGFDMQAPMQALEGLESSDEADGLRALLIAALSPTADESAWHELAEAARRSAEGSGAAHACLVTTVAQFAEARIAARTGEWPELAHALSRERALAENIYKIAERLHPGQRILVWGHNGHVGRYENCMGTHLSETFGEDYRSLGFVFDHGSYAAATMSGGQIDRVLRPFEAAPPEPGSAEELLRIDGKPLYFVDLHGADLPEEFRLERPHRQIGLVGGLEDHSSEPLAAAFDALVYTDMGSAAIPLPWSEDEITRLQAKASV